MTVPQSIRGFPDEPLYSHLLRLSKEIEHEIIDDPRNCAKVTYEELLSDILVFQDVLRRALPNELIGEDGLKGGNAYIAILCPMSYDFIVALYAVHSLGFGVVPFSTKLIPEEITELLGFCGAKCIVTGLDQSARFSDLGGRAEVLLGNDIVNVPISVRPAMRRHVQALGGPFIEKGTSFPSTHPGLMIFTSGTTGPPKGVVHSRAFFDPRLISGTKPGGRVLYQRPPHSITGVMNLMDLISTGICVEIFPTGYVAASVWERLAAGGITVLFGPPVMWTHLMDYYVEKLCHLPSSELSPYLAGVRNLQVVWIAAGLATTRVKKFWLGMLSAEFQIKYSMTEFGREALSYKMTMTSDPTLAILGKPAPRMDVKLSKAGHGEILLKAPDMFQGYFNDQTKTHDSLTDDGYFKTGDLAHVDHNGLYIFDGRASADFARFSTYIVPLLEVEAALTSLPYIAEGYILPVPDETHGQLVGALARLRPGPHLDGPQLTLKRLRADLSPSIPLYKQPTLLRVIVDEEIPVSGQGKLARNKAIDMYLGPSADPTHLQKWDLGLEMRLPGKKAWDWGGITL
ncbi:hypothetical protein PDE_00081 [Penicillium oxalicum 114-2]|uniref:AMP-dependent synthetase/ligase domain-containing protein n=1 Tax=Penicillium oxalicum (strain 114-2 / CGMCC 5302) TaxID=933388 RepID=S7Z3Q2_PENO1|nr:hypothetical protein PDE_00081 [Penicillium oxalicum 114-2]